MLTENRLLSLDHPLSRLVTTSIHHLLRIKARLPLLLAVVAEAKRISAEDRLVRNDIVVRMFLDSSDMLVIDLCSLRDQVSRPGGMFLRLKQHTPNLRRFRPRDCDVEWMRVEEWSRESQEAHLEGERQKMAQEWNRHFDFLFPDGEPVTHDKIDALISRFLADTKATEADRDKARAHRYEEDPSVAARHVQPLEGVQAQVAVFEKYFHSLCWLLTGANYQLDGPGFSANVEGTAQDMADLILLGSINEATVQYGLVPDNRDMARRYCHMREQFFASGGRLED
jgi:hypothetical protein